MPEWDFAKYAIAGLQAKERRGEWEKEFALKEAQQQADNLTRANAAAHMVKMQEYAEQEKLANAQLRYNMEGMAFAGQFSRIDPRALAELRKMIPGVTAYSHEEAARLAGMSQDRVPAGAYVDNNYLDILRAASAKKQEEDALKQLYAFSERMQNAPQPTYDVERGFRLEGGTPNAAPLPQRSKGWSWAPVSNDMPGPFPLVEANPMMPSERVSPETRLPGGFTPPDVIPTETKKLNVRSAALAMDYAAMEYQKAQAFVTAHPEANNDPNLMVSRQALLNYMSEFERKDLPISAMTDQVIKHLKSQKARLKSMWEMTKDARKRDLISKIKDEDERKQQELLIDQEYSEQAFNEYFNSLPLSPFQAGKNRTGQQNIIK